MTWILSIIIMVGGNWHPLDMRGAPTAFSSLEACKLAASEVLVAIYPLETVEGIAASCKKAGQV